MHASCFIQQNIEEAKQNSKKQKFENGLLRRNIRSFQISNELNKTSFDYTKDFKCRSFCIFCDIMHASCFIQQNVEEAKQCSKKQKFEKGLLRRYWAL
jgi:hypothetical protein